MSGSHLSKDLFELVKAIGESKSKQEEDRIILDEVQSLKRKMPEATVGRKRMKEFLVRLMYVEMLGHDASFGYIKAIELTASQNLAQKKAGYLCCSLCLSPEHEFRFMLVNQLQRDLASSNHLETCAALCALTKLLTLDMIPAIIGEVVKLLRHEREIVRKKAVMVLQSLHQLDPSSVSHLGDAVRRTLCDKDPSVMGAALYLLHDLIRDDTSLYKDLVPSFVSILKQITEHRLPRDYDYHRMPAPWIQMRLLQILAMLGRGDKKASEGMYEVLRDVMRRADTGINVGYAIVYECIRTVTSIYPDTSLLDLAAASISRFLSSENHNLKYVGITGLTSIVKDHPKYASEHQLAVIDCLEDPDETLKRKTLDLLYSMVNPVNVEFITDKLISFVESACDTFWRADLAKRITQCAERFAPSSSWYVGVMARVFVSAGELVQPEVAHNLMQLIAEGGDEGEEEEAQQLRCDAVETLAALFGRPRIPDSLAQTMAWVLGEYSYVASDSLDQKAIAAELCKMVNTRSFKDPSTKGYIISALMKLSAQLGEVPPMVVQLITDLSKSVQTDLQQRCLEFLALARRSDIMVQVLPMDASCEDIQVDESLGFLDDFVAKALQAGALPYAPPSDLSEDEIESLQGVIPSPIGLKLAPYAKPFTAPTLSQGIFAGMPLPKEPSSSSDVNISTPRGMMDNDTSFKLKPSVQVWGRLQSQNVGTIETLNAAPPAEELQRTVALPLPTLLRAGSFPPPESSQKSAAEIERERQAKALFGGLGLKNDPRNNPVSAGISRSTRSKLHTASQPSSIASDNSLSTNSKITDNMVDLLDMGNFGDEKSNPDASNSEHNSNSPTNGVVVDSLLDLIAGDTLETKAIHVPELPSKPVHQSLTSDDIFQQISMQSKQEKIDGYRFRGKISIQPMSITTSDFGRMWVSGTLYERVGAGIAVRATTNLSQISMVCVDQKGLNLNAVELIEATTEGIWAGTLPLGISPIVVLVHIKHWPSRGAVDVTVRSGNTDVSEDILTYAKNALALLI